MLFWGWVSIINTIYLSKDVSLLDAPKIKWLNKKSLLTVWYKIFTYKGLKLCLFHYLHDFVKLLN